MALSLRRLVGYVLLFTLWGIPPSRALAIQKTSVVLLDESSGWQPARSDLNWSAEDGDRDRLPWIVGGSVLGAGLGYVFLVATHPFDTDPPTLEFVLGGAAFGALAGFLISGPSPYQENELKLGYAFRPYIPAQGGVGLALDF